jgi:hypothetical protein
MVLLFTQLLTFLHEVSFFNKFPHVSRADKGAILLNLNPTLDTHISTLDISILFITGNVSYERSTQIRYIMQQLFWPNHAMIKNYLQRQTQEEFHTTTPSIAKLTRI